MNQGPTPVYQLRLYVLHALGQAGAGAAMKGWEDPIPVLGSQSTACGQATGA